MYYSLITVDDDKVYGYKTLWKKAGIHFYHGALLYLLTKAKPYCDESRMILNGFIVPYQWVINNYNKFKDYLPPVKITKEV